MFKKKPVKYLLISLSFILILLVTLAVWLVYGNPWTPAKIRVYQALPVPMAFVGTRPILMKDFLRRYELAQTLYSKSARASESQIKGGVLQSLIEQKKLEGIAKDKGITVSQKQLGAEFERRKDFSLTNQNQSLESQLTAVGLTPGNFKEIILKPDLLATNLIIWFNGQESLNSAALAKARKIKKSIDGGAAIQELAKSQSDDNSGKLLEGDMGFVEISNLLPELQGGLDSMTIGETKIFTSRYGAHIIKLAEKDNKGSQNGARTHLFQIFIKPADFQQWYENEAKKIKVTNIIKIK